MIFDHLAIFRSIDKDHMDKINMVNGQLTLNKMDNIVGSWSFPKIPIKITIQF